MRTKKDFDWLLLRIPTDVVLETIAVISILGIDENIKTNHSIHYISNSESKAMSYEILVWGLKTTLVFF